MAVPVGVKFLWFGTNASIPANYSRDTSFDSRYFKGTAAGVDPAVTGGATTHTHTSNAHNHTQNAHNHTVTLGNAVNNVIAATGGVNVANNSHNHTSSVTDNQTTTNQT